VTRQSVESLLLWVGAADWRPAVETSGWCFEAGPEAPAYALSVIPAGLEPAAYGLGNRRSIRLSYGIGW
jgi:hypothetical protein